MNKKLSIILIIIGLFSSNTLKAENVFYCQVELAVGFYKEDGSWRTSTFNNVRYTIKFNNDYSKLYGLDENRSYNCVPSYSHKPEALACFSGYTNGQTFIFHKDTKRFVNSSPKAGSGYAAHGNDSGYAANDTDVIEGGTCTKF